METVLLVIIAILLILLILILFVVLIGVVDDILLDGELKVFISDKFYNKYIKEKKNV